MIRAAAFVLAGAVALLAWTTLTAVRVDEPPALPFESAAFGSAGANDVGRAPHSAQRLLSAVEQDPFQPARRRPAQRFRMPGDAPVAVQTPVSDVRVVGTAVGPDGGFAMCSWAGGAPRIVRVGQRVGDWTLSKVTPGAAEFTAATGSTMVVRIAKAGT